MALTSITEIRKLRILGNFKTSYGKLWNTLFIVAFPRIDLGATRITFLNHIVKGKTAHKETYSRINIAKVIKKCIRLFKIKKNVEKSYIIVHKNKMRQVIILGHYRLDSLGLTWNFLTLVAVILYN